MLRTSGRANVTAVAGRVSTSRRRVVLLVVAVCVAALAAAVLYVRGGDRLSGSGGGVSGPVTIGEEFHTMASLDTGGGTVELVSVTTIGTSPGLRAEVSLVELGDAPPLGSARGPLNDRYRVVDLAGHRLHTSRPDDLRYWLDIRLIATTEGIHQIRAVAVTYRAGFLRERTAVLPVPVCLSASEDWKAAPEADCPLPDSADPSTIVPSATEYDGEQFGEVLRVRLEVPKSWHEDTSAEADEWRYSAIGADGEMRLRTFDNLDRSPDVETGGSNPTSLRAAADLFVRGFPEEFGTAPELTEILLDGRPAMRIRPGAPPNSSGLETILTTGQPGRGRYLELRGPSKVLDAVISTFRWIGG
ncbi:MAG: hypothetical protein ACT4OV_01540 [Microthrixaceae bacterium]